MKVRPVQGERLRTLRAAAGLSQIELAELIGESQQNVAYWEQAEKPPRSDVLPKMAKALGVSVEEILGEPKTSRNGGAKGKLRLVFDEVSRLPRRQQDKVVEIVTALVEQYKRSSRQKQ